MRIMVCLKQVPTPGTPPLAAEGGLRPDAKAGFLLNPFDGNALEAALRLQESAGAEIVALSMGEKGVVSVLREALAMGADEAVHVPMTQSGWTSLQTACLLAAAVRELGMPDLLLTGRESTVFSSGAVGPMLAELLAIPHIAGVRTIRTAGESSFEVERSRGKVIETIAVDAPVLLTISREVGEARYPTVREVLAASKVKIPVLYCGQTESAQAELDQFCRVKDMSARPVPSRSNGEILEGTVEEQAGILLKRLEAEGILQ
jgi:electron transfer flavoprotein beta subunit